MASIFPPIGSWHQDPATQRLFEVVAIDDNSGTLEVQYEDGDLDEFDIGAWGQLNAVVAAAPIEGNAGFGDIPFGSDDTDQGPLNPLEIIEPESFDGYDDTF